MSEQEDKAKKELELKNLKRGRAIGLWTTTCIGAFIAGIAAKSFAIAILGGIGIVSAFVTIDCVIRITLLERD